MYSNGDNIKGPLWLVLEKQTVGAILEYENNQYVANFHYQNSDLMPNWRTCWRTAHKIFRLMTIEVQKTQTPNYLFDSNRSNRSLGIYRNVGKDFISNGNGESRIVNYAKSQLYGTILFLKEFHYNCDQFNSNDFYGQ